MRKGTLLLNKCEKLSAIIEHLDKTLNASLYDIGFMKGTIDNPNVAKKINGSFSGHALEIAIRAVAEKCALYVAKTWDTQRDCYSIPNAVRLLMGRGAEIEERRRSKHPDWPDSFLETGCVENKIVDLGIKVDQISNSNEFISVLIYRTEHAAHRLDGISRERKRISQQGIEITPASYNQIISLATNTAEVTCQLVQIWNFSVKNPNEWITTQKENTELFWETLPVLADAEEF